jgi:hypothetical protein
LPDPFPADEQASQRAFAGLLEKTGNRFPEAAALVESYLRPIPHLDMFAYRMKKRDDEGEGYSDRFPAESRKVLDAMAGPEPQTAPWNLRELLETIATASPALRQRDIWRRLRSIGQQSSVVLATGLPSWAGSVAPCQRAVPT